MCDSLCKETYIQREVMAFSVSDVNNGEGQESYRTLLQVPRRPERPSVEAPADNKLACNALCAGIAEYAQNTA